MVTALCLAATLVIALAGQVFPSFLTRMGGTGLQQGLLLFAMFLFYPVSSLLAGTISDRVGKRPVVAAGLLLMAVPFALSAAIPDLRVRTLAVLLFGLGEGAVESQVSALLSDLNPGRERSVMNWAQMMFSAGAAGGPFLLAILFSLPTGATLVSVLWACAVLGFLLALGFQLNSRGQPAWPPAAALHAAEPPPPSGLPRLNRLYSPTLLLMAVALFLYVAAEMGTASWLAKYGELHLGFSPALSPVCITVFWAGLSSSRILAGLLSDRVPDTVLLYSSILLTLAGQVLAFSVRAPAAALAGFAVIGIGMGPLWPTLVAMAGRRYRRTSGTAIGALVAAGGLAVALVQLLVGWLSNPRLLGLRWTLLALAAFTAANLWIVRAALHSSRSDRPSGILRT